MKTRLACLFFLMIAFLLGISVRPSTTENHYIVHIPHIFKNEDTAAFVIDDISDNRSDYPDSQISKYSKFEITFQINGSTAGNYQLPYDPNPPNGLDPDYAPHSGISVDGLFTPDDWKTVYRQPAFYYQYFDEDVKESWDGNQHGWFSPSNKFSWKIRFSPNSPGTWQYKIRVEDSTGSKLTWPVSFEVIDSSDKGFIRVSQADRRYFEFDNGEIFHPIGLQGVGRYTVDALADPIATNEPAYQKYNQNGINFVRIWMSGIYGSAWTEWIGVRNIYDGYLPRAGIVPHYDPHRDRLTMTQRIDYEPDGDTGFYDGCRFQFFNNPEAVKPNTNYRLRIKYWGEGMTGPRLTDHPNYGLVAKIGGGWRVNCTEPGTSNVVTHYGGNTNDWEIIEGTWNSGLNNFVPAIYIGLENVKVGRAYVSSISLQEELDEGGYGPEIIAEPSMEYELYFPEQEVHSLDKILEIAEKYGVYLKIVINEKYDMIFQKMDDDGSFVYLGEPNNNDGYYGLGRKVNKTRWLQQAWWRYLQARWGYSSAIHSWELTNEGDPWNTAHWEQADEFSKYMHCRVFGKDVGTDEGNVCEFQHPNRHLVTTSFWHSYPVEQYWGNENYQNMDYVDIHAYVSNGWLNNPIHESDSALFHLDYSSDARGSLDYFAELAGAQTKPVIRGETGIDQISGQGENPDLSQDSSGVWLHNLTWASLAPGAMIDLVWFNGNIESQPGPDGSPGLYEIYDYFADFVQGIPLNNGLYSDAEAAASDSNMRVFGQKDPVNGRAHLWVQNKDHTWRNVVDGVANISGLSGSVMLEGFDPGKTYSVEWHSFTTQGKPKISYAVTTSSDDGIITIGLPADPQLTDVGIKIGDYSP